MTVHRPGQHLVGGALRGLAAEFLFPATALITAAFLTRRLGADGYGLLVLAATTVGWVEWSTNAFFSRPTIKFISETEDWKPVADGLVRQQLLAGLVLMLLVWALAVPFSMLMNEPQLAWYLALFAVDIPLFNLAHAHRNILIGKGEFAPSATLSAVRWLSRLALIVAFVGAGLSVDGAILGTLGASVAELLVARYHVRPSLFGAQTSVPLWSMSVPLLISSLCLGLYLRLDLFALKSLGATTEEAGIYGAAQNLASLPGVFSVAFMPLLLSTLSRLVSRGEVAAATEIATNALRAAMALIPLAAVVAGSASELVRLFFGADFEPAGATLAVLILGSFCLMAIPMVAAIFIAFGNPGRVPWLSAPLVPLAVAGHVLFIPRYGAIGAAAVTTAVACMGASWAVWSSYRAWNVSPPGGTLARSAIVGVVAFAAASAWPAPGLLVLVKAPVIVAGCVLLFAALGEFTANERRIAVSMLARQA